jgi:hypothetical protein
MLLTKLLNTEPSRRDWRRKNSNQQEVTEPKVPWEATKMVALVMTNLLLEYLVFIPHLCQSNGRRRSETSEIFTLSNTQGFGRLSSIF